MLEEINQNLKELEEDVLLKERVELRVKELNTLLDQHLTKRQRTLAKYHQEKKDVEALKSLSLASLYYRLIGKNADKLAKEEREMLDAKMLVDRMDSELALLEDEYAYEKKRLDDIISKERTYQRLIDEKKTLLKQLPSVREDITRIDSEIIKKKTVIKEIDEALRAGEHAQNALYQASATLDSARNWGIYDIMSKKSLISSMVKQNKLKSAQSDMSRANHSLERFKSEMNDVQKTYTDELAFSGFVKTFDIWFDNIFTDIHVQRRINAARDDVSSTNRSIDHALRSLKNERDKRYKEVEVLEEELQEIIVEAR